MFVAFFFLREFMRLCCDGRAAEHKFQSGINAVGELHAVSAKRPAPPRRKSPQRSCRSTTAVSPNGTSSFDATHSPCHFGIQQLPSVAIHSSKFINDSVFDIGRAVINERNRLKSLINRLVCDRRSRIGYRIGSTRKNESRNYVSFEANQIR